MANITKSRVGLRGTTYHAEPLLGYALSSSSTQRPHERQSSMKCSYQQHQQTRLFGFRAPRSRTMKGDNRYESMHRNPYHSEQKEASIEHLARGQLYTPEAMQTINLTEHLKQLVNFGYEEPSLLDRYGDRAAALSQGFKPKEIAIVLNAFARTRHYHKGLLEAFARSIPPRLPGFDPKALSLTCNAFAKFKTWAKQNPQLVKKLFRRLSQEIPHKIPLFKPQHIANVAYSYAQLDIKDPLLFDDLVDEFLRRPEDFSAQELLMLTKAFARDTQVSDRRIQFWNTICHWLLEQRLDLEPRFMVMILNCLSKVNHGHKTLFDIFGQDLTAAAKSLDFVSCCLTINAFGRMRQYDEGLFQELTKRLVLLLSQPLGDVGHANLTASIIHSLGKLLRPCPEDLFLAISNTLQAHGDSLSPQAVSNLVHGMARLKRKDATLLAWAAKIIAKKSDSFTPEALCVILYSYARLKVRSEVLVYLVSQQLLKAHSLPKLSGQGLGMTLYALAKLKIEDERLINACKKQTRICGPALNEVEVCMIVHALSQLGKLDEQLSAVLNARLEALDASQADVGVNDDWWASWTPADPDEDEGHLRWSSDGASATVTRTSSSDDAPHCSSTDGASATVTGTSPFASFKEPEFEGMGRSTRASGINWHDDEHPHNYEDADSKSGSTTVPTEDVERAASSSSSSSGASLSSETFHSIDEESCATTASSGRKSRSSGSTTTSSAPETSSSSLKQEEEEGEKRDDLWTMLEQTNASSPASIKDYFHVAAQKPATRGRKKRRTS